MKDRAFHFEIRDLITQFIAAFDDVVIGRYNKSRQEQAQIKVRYVYAPKERVLFDIVNKAQNITLPVIAVSLNSISRDETRVFNKIYGFDVPGRLDVTDPHKYSRHVGMPVPVNISVSMNIIASYQTDIDQIISNFVPYNNPYVVISWKIPNAFELMLPQEIRSEVMWDGTVALKYPVDSTGSDKYRLEADTSFTIKGWLFPQAPADPVKNIFFIDSNFYSSRVLNSDRFKGYDTYYTLSGTSMRVDLSSNLSTEFDNITVSAAPTITNIYFAGGSKYHAVYDDEALIITPENIDGDFLLQGKRFQYTSNVFLSSNTPSFYTSLTSLSFDYYPVINAYTLPTSCYQIVNENIMNLTLPVEILSGDFDIIVQDEAGWDSTARKGVRLTRTL